MKTLGLLALLVSMQDQEDRPGILVELFTSQG